MDKDGRDERSGAIHLRGDYVRLKKSIASEELSHSVRTQNVPELLVLQKKAKM